MSNPLEHLLLRTARTDRARDAAPPANADAPASAAAALSRFAVTNTTRTANPTATKLNSAAAHASPNRRSEPPPVSSGLMEATAQLRRAIPPLHNFRLGPRIVQQLRRNAQPSNNNGGGGGGNFWAALRSHLKDAQQQQQRGRFLAGGRGGGRNGTGSSSNNGDRDASFPTTLNFVSCGLSHVPCSPALLAALANDFGYELNSFLDPVTSTSIGGSVEAGDDDSMMFLPSARSTTAAVAMSSLVVSIPSCRGERAVRIFLEASQLSSSPSSGAASASANNSTSNVSSSPTNQLVQLCASVKHVDTLYLSDNPAIGGLVSGAAACALSSSLSSSSSSSSSSVHSLTSFVFLRDVISVASLSPLPLAGLLHFPLLKKLSLANCGIRHVAQLAPLRFLPSLEHLFLEGNPLCAASCSSSSASHASDDLRSHSHHQQQQQQQQQPYRSSVICWFSHCACCCCAGVSFASNASSSVAAATPTTTTKRLTFRAQKLASLDGRAISQAERARAVSETSAHLAEMRQLRVLLMRSLLVTAVTLRLSLNAEFKHGATVANLAQHLPVFSRHLLPIVVAVKRATMMRMAAATTAGNAVRSAVCVAQNSYTAQFVEGGRRQQLQLLAKQQQQQQQQRGSHHHAAAALPADLRSRQKRAARLLLLLAILAQRASLAFLSPFFHDSFAAGSAFVFEPCLVCGNPAADSAVTTMIVRSQRRLCAAAASRRSRSELVAGRMPSWADAVRETKQQLQDTVEEGIVLLIHGLFAPPPQPHHASREGGGSTSTSSDGVAPLLACVTSALRNWPQGAAASSSCGNSSNNNNSSNNVFACAAPSAESTRRFSFVCGLPVPNIASHVVSSMPDGFAAQLDRALLRGIDDSLLARDASFADISAMLLTAPMQYNNSASTSVVVAVAGGNSSAVSSTSAWLLSGASPSIPRQRRVAAAQEQGAQQRGGDNNNGDEGEDDDDELMFLSAPLFDGVSDHRAAALSSERAGDGGRMRADSKPSAQLTESESDVDDGTPALDAALAATETADNASYDDDDDDQLLIVADEFHQNELLRGCFVRWLQRLHRASVERDDLLSSFRALADFEAKRRAFFLWRNRFRAGELAAARNGALLMQCFYAWRARARIARDASIDRAQSDERRRREEQQERDWNDVADAFRRGALLEAAMARWKDAASTQRAERLLAEVWMHRGRHLQRASAPELDAVVRAVADWDSACGGAGAAAAVRASERLRLEDAVRLAVLRRWRQRLLDERSGAAVSARRKRALQRRGQQQEERSTEDHSARQEQQQHLAEASRRVIRRARRQLWRTFAHALKTQHVRDQVFRQGQRFDQDRAASVSVPRDLLAVAERELDLSLADISGVSDGSAVTAGAQHQHQRIDDSDLSLFLADDSAFLPIERRRADGDGEFLLAPPAQQQPQQPRGAVHVASTAAAAAAAASCDVSDIDARSDALSAVGEAALREDSKHLSPAPAATGRQAAPRFTLRDVRVVRAFHRLAESMAKTG